LVFVLVFSVLCEIGKNWKLVSIQKLSMATAKINSVNDSDCNSVKTGHFTFKDR